MGVSERFYKYTDGGCQKVRVPMEQVSELSQLQKADHIAFQRFRFVLPYKHHAIVEYIDEAKGTIHAIEYTNVEVKRSKYTLGSGKLFLIKHKKCFDADTVVLNAQSRLGERKYNVVTNNCEHFALWCKTGISSSEQVKNAEKDILKQAIQSLTDAAASEGGKTIVTTTVREATKALVTQTVTKGGQEVLKTGLQTAVEQVVTQTMTKCGQEVLKTSVQTAAKQIVRQTVTMGGQEVLKSGVGEAAKQVTTQTFCNSAQTVVTTGVLKVSKQVVSQSVSRGGQEIVERGTLEATKEVFTRTAKKAGEEIVTKGARETTREVITQTSKSNGAAVRKSALGGKVFAVAIEGALAAYDISCANADLKSGKISEAEYNDAVGERIWGGIGNVGGSTAGAIVGQVLLFPFPVAGSVIGSFAGGWVGKMYGSYFWNNS